MNLYNRIAIVTGANKGIGLECVNQLLEKGATVYGLCRSGCTTQHDNYHCLVTDVRNHESLQTAFDKVLTAHGKIDILINNAGLGYFGFCEEISLDQWQEMFDTNVTGLFYATRLALPSMKKQGLGHIINISSIAGLEGYQQVSGYCATKFAVRGFSDALYKEVREDGVRVTCVYPGSVKTDFFRNSENIKPHDYMLDPDDLAEAMVNFLRMPLNFHTVNLEIRPLQPKGPRKPASS
jgi:NADP-dependent 3-hydroxy acid dehydrogenase YdfG